VTYTFRMDSRFRGRTFLIAGDAGIRDQLLALLRAEGIVIEANPDIYWREYLSFGIEDAREIRDRAQVRAIGEGFRVFVLITPSITVDAQNALLKTVEEPPAGASFFLVVPSPQALLPTLRSRSQVLNTLSVYSLSSIDPAAFLSATREGRIDALKELYQKEEGEERDLRGVMSFLAGIERHLGARVSDADARKGLEAVYRARKYCSDKGALLKPLLEQVALLTPRI